MTSRLTDYVAIVTGAASGIGAATADLFRQEGAVVYGADLRPGQHDHDRHLDVSDSQAWETLVDEIVRQHGRVDVLVNNAGLVGSYEDIVSVGLEDFDRVLQVNLYGTMLGMRSTIPAMAESNCPSIINVCSIWGVAGADGVAAYQASKGAVRSLTKNAAITYAGRGIRANALLPGLVLTPLIEIQDTVVTERAIAATPLKRGAHPREVAQAALFLASSESSFVTGAEIAVDGGFLAA